MSDGELRRTPISPLNRELSEQLVPAHRPITCKHYLASFTICIVFSSTSLAKSIRLESSDREESI